ncbi:hypothetical protein BC936DRAFT_146262 [Jimgerdemannia flammicorona]|uniref:Uncharacterized protein n=1 Tax=Jimgerdemannia flammicorona TaxID=994334 RepID=A0A433D8Q4_9FUNG|nr:hypothetical protein BC936DRAFT_146262 [Jimgerdemannia flammicorona]
MLSPLPEVVVVGVWEQAVNRHLQKKIAERWNRWLKRKRKINFTMKEQAFLN